MAYPYQISTHNLIYPTTGRPIYTNGKLYQGVYDSGTIPSPEDYIRVVKSEDNGINWSLQDDSNAPSVIHNLVFYHSHSAFDGVRIWFIFSPHTTIPPPIPTESYLKAFNTVNDTWETSIVGGPAAQRNNVPPTGFELSDDAKLWLIIRSNGDKVVIYSEPVNVSGTNYSGLKFRIYNGSSWSGAHNLIIPGITDGSIGFNLMGAVLGSSGLIHILAGTIADGFAYITIKNDNSLANYIRWSAEETPPLIGLRDALWGLPALTSLNNNSYAVFPIMKPAPGNNNFYPGLLLIPDEENPVLDPSTRIFSSESVHFQSGFSSWLSVVFSEDPVLRLLLENSEGATTYLFPHYYQQDLASGVKYLLWPVAGEDKITQIRLAYTDLETISTSILIFQSGLGELIETLEVSEFHSGLLTIVVADTLNMLDFARLLLQIGGSGGSGIIDVDICPDIVASSACADVKTISDGEPILTNCEENIFTESGQPC